METRRLNKVAALLAAVLLLAAAPFVVGCGNSRTPVPSLSQPAAPGSFRALAYPGAGLSLRAPSTWSVTKEQPPLVAVIASGSAAVAVWHFPRSAAPPDTPAALTHATDALVAAARARDPSLQLIRTRVETLGSVRAIELDAFEHINGQPRRVRSMHLFVSGGEVVLDEYAPPAIFHAVDHAVFSPVKRSLRIVPAV